MSHVLGSQDQPSFTCTFSTCRAFLAVFIFLAFLIPKDVFSLPFFFPQSVLQRVTGKSSVCTLFYSQMDFSVIFIKQSNNQQLPVLQGSRELLDRLCPVTTIAGWQKSDYKSYMTKATVPNISISHTLQKHSLSKTLSVLVQQKAQ